MEYKITVTTLNFASKEDAKERVKFTNYKTVDVSIDEHISLITQGYAFCSVMQNDRRKDTNFQYSNTLTYDVDDCTIGMNDYIANLTIPPTFAYTSSSNGIEGKGCRYRLVYVLDEPIRSLEEYKLLSKSFAAQQDMPSLDSGSYEASRLWFGNANQNVEVYKSYNVLSKNVINLNKDFLKNKKKELITKDSKSISQTITTLSHHYTLSDTFQRDYQNMSFQSIIEKYMNTFINLERTPLDYDDSQPIITYPSNYFEIRRPWKKINGETLKISDGNNRRKKLFINGVIRRKICPSLTFDNLVYNLVYEFEYYYINDGNTITKKDILDIATNVMKCDLTRFEDLGKPVNKSFVNEKYCEKHDLTKKQVLGQVRNKKQYIGEFFDPSLTDKQNLDIMKEYGLEISLITLKRWKKENGIKKYKKS